MKYTRKLNRRAPYLAVLFALLAGPGLAGNESRFEAFPLENGTFEVVARFSEDAIYWCGAAVHAGHNTARAVPT